MIAFRASPTVVAVRLSETRSRGVTFSRNMASASNVTGTALMPRQQVHGLGQREIG